MWLCFRVLSSIRAQQTRSILGVLGTGHPPLFSEPHLVRGRHNQGLSEHFSWGGSDEVSDSAQEEGLREESGLEV